MIPVSFFDTSKEDELKLCWNSLNIRVASLEGNGTSTDLTFAKAYFERLYACTGFSEATKFIAKIESITNNNSLELTEKQLAFIESNMKDLMAIPGFTKEEYAQYLETESAQAILTEREILKKVENTNASKQTFIYLLIDPRLEFTHFFSGYDQCLIRFHIKRNQ